MHQTEFDKTIKLLGYFSSPHRICADLSCATASCLLRFHRFLRLNCQEHHDNAAGHKRHLRIAFLRQDLFQHVAMDVGEAPLDAVVVEAEPLVVEPEDV